VSKEGALQRLEGAFRDWYWETGTDMPDVGIVVIGLSRGGCDLQYLGVEPKAVIDWPTLFTGIVRELERGRYSVNNAASVDFPSQR